MAKKKTDKETEPKKISKNRFTTFFKSETTHFVIGRSEEHTSELQSRE